LYCFRNRLETEEKEELRDVLTDITLWAGGIREENLIFLKVRRLYPLYRRAETK
jgi:hypothetical protein